MILLDTCSLLWLASEQTRLSPEARDRISAGRDGLFVSAISAFEIAIKHKRGRLTLPRGPAEWFALALHHHGVREIAVDHRIAVESTALPDLHADPCDRIVIATAKVHGLCCLTPDPLIRQYPGVDVVW